MQTTSTSKLEGVIYANITHTFDIEVIRYRLRVEFAKSAKFNHKAFKKISEKFEVSLDEAKAMYFADLNALCHQFSEEGVNFLNRHSIAILEKAFNEIHKAGLTKAIRNARKKSNVKLKSKNSLEYETINDLMNDAHLFIKSPRVGRPTDLKDKSETITSTLVGLMSKTINGDDQAEIEKVLSGELGIPKITRTSLAAELGISRPTLNDWFVKSDKSFDECIDLAERKFLASLRIGSKGAKL